MNKMLSYRNIAVFLAVYITCFILVLIILKFSRFLDNDISKSLIYAIFISIMAFILLGISPSKIRLTEGKNLLRYSMLCKKCGWEWMSHSTSKGIHPVQCPKCGNSKKASIELVGWRKFDISASKDKDLRHFFK